MAKQEYITIVGARVNNLKDISLKIPRNKLTVVTGVSGSGKSSLAFDTLYAEGQRRFAESLSSFARQFLGRMTKPDVDKIAGIPPAVAIQQRTSTRNPRSTVGTTTEIYDYLRTLYAKIGKTYSPISGEEVKRHTTEDIISYISKFENNTKIYILVALKFNISNDVIPKLLTLKQSGYSRLFLITKGKGEIIKIDDFLKTGEKSFLESAYILLSRYILNSDLDISELRSSLESAFSQGEGYLTIGVQKEGGERVEIKNFSNLFEADGIRFEEPTELMFSFNNPIGACTICGGYGSVEGISEKLVIPNPSLSVYEDCVAPWRGKVMGMFKDELINNAYKFDFPIHKPYITLSKEQKKILWDGNDYFQGINSFFKWVDSKKHKIQYKYLLHRYSGKTTCPSCNGSRLKKEVSYVKIANYSISELLDMSVDDLLNFFKTLKLSVYERKVAERVLKEIVQRLEYVANVGLGYLTLSRKSNTLSGGESQRINLVSSLGSSLVGSLYILDEPSVGLHPADTEKLISVIKKLRDIGNTIVIVEHDADIIRSADYLIDIGPYAGIKGGEIVYEGVPPTEKTSTTNRSLTVDYLTGVKKVDTIRKVRDWSNSIKIEGAMENNLKNINVQFPLNTLTVVTGVSGSGKSSLVGDVLYPALCQYFQILSKSQGAFKSLSGDLNKINGVEYIDQNPMGKSARSNPVTYLKIYDEIRKLLSDQPYAKLNGYGNSFFSFNVDGGRCPICLGEGYITVPMQFMADVKMVCEECGGKRFKQDILEVKYKGKNVLDILNMSVDEAIDFFSSHQDNSAQKIAKRLEVLQKVGLGYIQLGQSSSTLSGGESQRVMLAQFLSSDSKVGGKFYIFDEPTTGLHFNDIKKLLDAFNAIIDAGNTILVVEHNIDVIKSADWIIDLGPASGENGGEVVFTGTPEELSREYRWKKFLTHI